MASPVIEISGLFISSWTILGGVFVLLYLTFFRESRIDRMLKKFPGARDYPIVGHAHKLYRPEDAFKVIDGWLKQYGKRCRVYFGSSRKSLMLSDPVDLKKVLTSPELIEKPATYDVMRAWVGDGLLISKGQKWHTRRKLLTPAFHFKILENFQPIFDENSKVLVDILKKLDGKECEIHAMLARCTLDVICETAMGIKLNSQLDENNEYLRATLKETQLQWMRLTKPWLQFPFIWNLFGYGRDAWANRHALNSFTRDVIKERKKTFFAEKTTGDEQTDGADGELPNVHFSTKKRFAFLDLLLQIQASGEHELTDEDVQEETGTIMFGGHDTTAVNLSWTIYLLGIHTLHQERVHEELDSIFGDDRSRPIDMTDLPKLKYLEMCIKESMRLYPVAPLFSRLVMEDFELDKDLVVPKGAIIAINVYSAHRDPEQFPDPEEYRPERFSAENRGNRNPYAFIPFSAGSRNCIGQRFAMAEEKTILANIFRNFRVESLDSPENVKPLPELVLRPKDGIRIKCIPR